MPNFASAGTAHTVQVQNTGLAQLTFTNIQASANFAESDHCQQTPLAFNGQCPISVTFNPPTGGSFTGTLTLTDNSSTSPQTVRLSGTEVLSAPIVSPLSLNFNGQVVGTTSTSKPVKVTNTGPVALDITNLGISRGWTQSNNCLPSVAAHASCTISVSFHPSLTGPLSGALTLTDTAVNSPQTVSLSGTGLVPIAGIAPPSLAFGNQNQETKSTSKPVALSNTGDGPLTIASIATSASFGQTHTCGSSLGVGDSCTISVTFSPTATGPLTGTLTITDNNHGVAGSKQTVSLTGTGAPPTLSLAPSSANVGLSGTQLFTATISYAANTALNWYVNGVLNGNGTEGTLTGTGLTRTYKAPPVDVPSPNPAVIKVASAEDPSVFKTANVTVTDTIAVKVSPASVSLALGGAQTFAATLSNTTSTALKWYVNGVLNGNSAQGTLTACRTVAPLNCTYTAPDTNVPSPNPAVIKVVSVADPTKYKTASVTVTDKIVVTLNPATKTLALGGAQTFMATISNTTDTALNWYVNGVLKGNATEGTLTACTTVAPLNCTYTAPAINVPSPNPAVIKVVSVADPGKNKTASVTVTDSIAVGLSPATANVALGKTQVLTATLTGTTNTALDWYVNGVLKGNSTQGTLTACTTAAPLTCKYTAPPVNVPSPNPAVIKVVSVADPAKFKTASVTVTE